MLSICLQSMVDELMVKKSGGSIRKVRAGLAVSLGWDLVLSIRLPRVLLTLLTLLGLGPAEGPPGAACRDPALSPAPPCRCFAGG